jgi:hypothetical protein
LRQFTFPRLVPVFPRHYCVSRCFSSQSGGNCRETLLILFLFRLFLWFRFGSLNFGRRKNVERKNREEYDMPKPKIETHDES